MKTFWTYLLAFLAGVGAVLAYLWQKPEESQPLLTESIKQDLKEDISEIEKKKEELKKNGPEELTPDEVEDYWSKQ